MVVNLVTPVCIQRVALRHAGLDLIDEHFVTSWASVSPTVGFHRHGQNNVFAYCSLSYII
jgi:hypothetical protein